MCQLNDCSTNSSEFSLEKIPQNNAPFSGIEQVTEFKHLGSCLTPNNDMEKEITERNAAGNRCFIASWKSSK